MPKVVINRCYGGFGLSDEAFIEYHRRKGRTIYAVDTHSLGSDFWTKPPEELPEFIRTNPYWRLTAEQRKEYDVLCEEAGVYQHDLRDTGRTDPDLIAVVEEFGSERASGRFAKLVIVEVPDDVEWEIEEYNGNEWVAEKHRTW